MTAVLSPDRTYRYTLDRGPFVGCPGTRVCFVGLNPSTADETSDDPTLRRITGWARDNLFERVTIVNLFAYRATDPAELRTLDRDAAVGADNDAWISLGVQDATVICAWGANGGLHGRDREVLELLREGNRPLHVLALTKGGQPRHPLYLPSGMRPLVWDPESGETS